MPRPILLATIVEILLIVGAIVFMVQPVWIVGRAIERGDKPVLKTVFNGIGIVLMSLTFCWSVILGVLLVLNGLTLRI